MPEAPRLLPEDDAERRALHDEVHARPPARIRFPALVVYIGVLNAGVSREAERAHLARLPGLGSLSAQDLRGNFRRFRWATHTLKWERHTEFTRYMLIQPAIAENVLPDAAAGWPQDLVLSAQWLRDIPGHTFCAILLSVEHDALDDPAVAAWRVGRRFGERAVVASRIGDGKALAVTDFDIAASGFERMVLLAPPGTSDLRAGRMVQRLLELETYRLMALRGLPVAKTVAPELARAEARLVALSADLAAKRGDDAEVLDALVGLAVEVERVTAEQSYRFAATKAYDELVRQRIAELHEAPVDGAQAIGAFMTRRFSPAIATVAATAARLSSLSERIERACALLRTRVDIVREGQNQQLLAKLTRGQELQLRLQATVEGLSIAAISYYVVSLVLYVGKAAHAAGFAVHPEILTGASIPPVLWIVWRGVRRLREALEPQNDTARPGDAR
jgi:uncharacterized membrane-anchored protein